MKPIKNRRAYFDYAILETLEVGVVLRGHEVKSVKEGQISLKDSYVIVKGEELFLLNASITKYKYMGDQDYDPLRTRKLLAKKKEIASLVGKIKQKNLTLVPLKVYLKGKKVKLEIGLVKGKKKYEKKESIKKRELERDLHCQKRRFVV